MISFSVAGTIPLRLEQEDMRLRTVRSVSIISCSRFEWQNWELIQQKKVSKRAVITLECPEIESRNRILHLLEAVVGFAEVFVVERVGSIVGGHRATH